MTERLRQLHARVYGRVQMVMFRDFVTRTARGLSLQGIVRNLDDGSVEVIAEGTTAPLEQFLDALRKGPLLSKVERVKADWNDATGIFTNFHIDYGT